MGNRNSFLDCCEPVGYVMSDTKSSWNAFVERSEIARQHSVVLVSLTPSRELIRAVKDNQRIPVKYWNGKSMVESHTEVPQAVYERFSMQSRTRLQEKMVRSLQERGVHFVNTPYARAVCADKFSTYELLNSSGVPTPNTDLYSPMNLERMIQTDDVDKVFVKRRVSSQGKHQFIISQPRTNSYLVESSAGTVWQVKGLAALSELLEERGVQEEYIVQEGVQVDRLEGRVYDFRALFQRGEKGVMSMTCCYMRVGAPNKNQANIGKRGHPHDPSLVFEEYGILRNRIKKMGLTAVSGLGKELGDVGVDLVLSSDNELSVLELNSKPGSKGLRTLRQWQPREEWIKDITIIPYEYSNRVRSAWGDRLERFLLKPLLYAQSGIGRNQLITEP